MLKDSFLHPVVLLLTFAVIFCAVSGTILLAQSTAVYNPIAPETPGWFQRHLAPAASSALIVSVLASLFLLFGRIQHKPGNRLLSFILPLLLSVIIVIAGFSIIIGPPGTPKRVSSGTYYPFVPKTIHSIESGLIYVDNVILPTAGGFSGDGIRLERVVRYSEGRLEYDRTAAAGLKSRGDRNPAAIIPGSTSLSQVPIVPENPIYSPMFEVPPLLRAMISEINLLDDYLLSLRAMAPESFVLAVFSISLFAMSCVVFLGLTAWPLFNALITLVLFRTIFIILRFFDSDIGREVSGLVSNQRIASLLPAFVYLGIGLLFVAINLLFVRGGSHVRSSGGGSAS